MPTRPSPAPRFSWFAVALLAALSSSACDDDARGTVAELSGISGAVDRDFASAPERWSAALLGARFRMGDGLRTGTASSARLELSPEGSALVERNTVVRFSADAPGENAQHIVLETGSLELSTDRFEVVVHTPRALTRLAHRSRAKVWSNEADNPARIELSVGHATVLRSGDAQPTELAPGRMLALSAPAPVSPPASSAPAAALPAFPTPVPAPTPASAPVAATAAVTTAPEVVDLRLSVAERAVLHASRLPVYVVLSLPPCDAASELRVGAQRFQSANGSARVRLGRGQHPLDFRCGTSHVARGSLTVRRDEARSVVPGAPPEVPIATDGRSYQVRHSGTPPAIHVRWPDAPSAGPYVLSVTAGGHTRDERCAMPERRLEPREIATGPMQLRFRSANGAVSRITAVQVTFDESSHLLQWRVPHELAARESGPMVIQGTVLPGSRVRVAEKWLAVSANGNFQGLVDSPPPGNALITEVTHPLLGRHYYVRRLR